MEIKKVKLYIPTRNPVSRKPEEKSRMNMGRKASPNPHPNHLTDVLNVSSFTPAEIVLDMFLLYSYTGLL
ncbi:MAG: hypothetical protein A2925_02080 [Candidatus Yanofskybacteria bacterium RIFCSPLOWO2_01_FULL_44_22]|uniref:Uncharacterized protein n=1 Tax=Candidatus Yanofskybacteria bacterium RIFCSPLOWO2_01_FULL_44_22 TaxID=1802697 RepID=A0A1F8GJA3_9BACT|nr:MAG: hypothetical protein A2925_02080 [Candidatus Yanofskybacteria bacterium RIFCSPLOWO2_01_FULL_44_22]